MDDERNHLYKEMLRIIKDKKPKYFVAENVKGILSLEKGEVIKLIVNDFKKIMDDNFYNIVHFLNHCITKMSDSSSVVFFSSIAAVRGFKNHTAISSAKSALIGLSNSLAADYAPKIRFNTISPSLSFSKMSNFMVSNEKVAEGIGKLHPMSRLGTGDDIGNLASFLVSKKSSWITGQNFQLDGGRSTLITK